jgi:hypothetical protein
VSHQVLRRTEERNRAEDRDGSRGAVGAGRVFLLEPSLRDGAGHRAFAAARFAELIGAQRTTIVAGAGWGGASTLAGAPVRPVFRTDPFAASRIRRYGRLVARLGTAAERLSPQLLARIYRPGPPRAPDAQALRAKAHGEQLRSLIDPPLGAVLDAFGAGPDDHIFVPSGDAEMLRAVVDLLGDRTPGAAPRAWFRLMYDDVGRHPTDLTIETVLTALTEVAGAATRVRLSTETATFAAAIRAAIGWEVDVIPHPIPAMLPSRTRAPTDGRFVIHLAGQVRADKGAAHVAAIVEALAASWRSRLRPLLAAQAPLDAVAPVETRRLSPNLEETAYRAVWADADLGLLLHDPQIYARRGSGVVCDAVAAGVPFVCLEGASLAEWTIDGNGIAAAPRPGAIAAAIIEVAERLEAFRIGARRAARRLAARASVLP